MPENWNLFASPNIGLLINRGIYRQPGVLKKLDYDDKENELRFNISKNEKSTPFDPFYEACYAQTADKLIQLKNPLATETFHLYTTYPGLLCGSGYTHDTGSTGDFKIGFFFDHTTGQPVIPGSSVKGVLRQFFELDRDEKETDRKLTRNVTLEFFQWVLKDKLKPDTTELTKEQLSTMADKLTEEELNELKMEIFGHQEQGGKDLFFDAVIDKEKTGSKKYLSNDFITPHKSKGDNRELDPFSNPTPLMFLKVLPGVAFEFRFKLAKTRGWDESFKISLFKELLLFNGIGAKTNVGYGQFVENALPNSPVLIDKGKKETTGNSAGGGKSKKKNAETPSKPAPIAKDGTWVEASILEIGSTVTATVREYNNGSAKVFLHIDGYEFVKRIIGKYSVGDKVQLNITGISRNK